MASDPDSFATPTVTSPPDRRRQLVWLLLALAAAAGPARATTGERTVVLGDTLVVRSRSLADPVNPSASALTTRIDLADEPPGRDAADLLGGVAGFQVRRHGAVGASAVPSLRGSTAAQVRFYLDGIPLNEAQGGTADLDRIPLDRVEAVEVHRGVVPDGLGGIGGAGAVNFITLTDRTGLDLRAQVGSFGELGGRAVLGVANRAGTLAGTLLVHGLRADNDFEYLDHNQTFHEAADDTVRTRENSWIDRWGMWAAGALDTDRLAVRATLGHDRRDGGRPGPLGYLSPHATVRYATTDGQLHLDLDDGRLQGRLGAGRQEEYLHDPRGEVGFGPPGTDHSLSHHLTGRLRWAPALVKEVLWLRTGIEGRAQWRDDRSEDRTEPRRHRTTWSAMAAATLRLAAGRAELVPAVRWQRARDDFPPVPPLPWLPEEEAVVHVREDLSPSVGAVWTLAPDRWYLEAHAARTVRQPTWVELFGHRGGIQGNRELVPETISSADLAVSYRSGRGRWSGRLAAFGAETDDKIVFVQYSPRASEPDNIGRARTRGLEVELAAVLPAEVSLTGNLTWQRAEDLGGRQPVYAGKRLPFLPDAEARLRLRRSGLRWRPWLEVTHLGANYRDRANTELNKAPARTLVNLGLAGHWRCPWLGADADLTCTAEVVNLTDNVVYDVEGFPLPGRSWRAAVHLRN